MNIFSVPLYVINNEISALNSHINNLTGLQKDNDGCKIFSYLFASHSEDMPKATQATFFLLAQFVMSPQVMSGWLSGEFDKASAVIAANDVALPFDIMFPLSTLVKNCVDADNEFDTSLNDLMSKPKGNNGLIALSAEDCLNYAMLFTKRVELKIELAMQMPEILRTVAERLSIPNKPCCFAIQGIENYSLEAKAAIIALFGDVAAASTKPLEPNSTPPLVPAFPHLAAFAQQLVSVCQA